MNMYHKTGTIKEIKGTDLLRGYGLTWGNGDKTQEKEEDKRMPVIARFYGILIKMYFSQSEHGVPHVHAIYGEFNAIFAIESLEMIEGDLPARAQRLVKEWAGFYQKELLEMWNRHEFKQLPGLE